MEIKELLDKCELLLYKFNEYKGTINLCNRILKEENDNELALEYKAMAHYRLGEYSNALEVIDRGLTIYPENATLQNAKVSVFERTNKLRKHLKVLEAELAENDDIGLVDEKLHTLVRLEEYDNAYDYFMSLDDYVAGCCDYELLASKLNPNQAIDCLNKVVNDDIEQVDRIKLLFEKFNLDLNRFANQDLYLSWIYNIKSKNDTDVCPKCGGKLIPVLYGYPSPDALKRVARGEIALGGCNLILHNISHSYFLCEKCDEEFDMGVCGFNVEPENRLQYEYIQSKLSKVMSILTDNSVSYHILQKQLNKSLCKKETSEFSNHLRDINAIFVSESWSIVSLDENDIPKEKSYCDEGKYASPRWLVYPELSVGTIGWRMGYGEDYALNEPRRDRDFSKLFPQPRNWSVNLRKSTLRRFSLLGFIWNPDGKPKYSKITEDALEVNDFITPDDEGIFRNDTHFFNSIGEAISKSKAHMFEYYREEADEDELLEDWEALKYTVCLNACYYKFMENKRLKEWLLGTGERCLIYTSDDEWGGEENLFGFALMELRDEIRRLYANANLIDWEYTEYLKNKNPYENGTPQRDPNDKQSPEYKVVESTFVGASRYVRDVNLDEKLAGKYQIGQIIQERAFVDASNRIGGMVTSHRYLILSSYMADFSGFEENTNWGLHVANRDSRFKVVDIYTVGDKTQILLLQLPDGFEGAFENKTDVEDEFIERERKNFEEDLKREVIEELAGEMWLQRCEFPLGMDEKGEFFKNQS